MHWGGISYWSMEYYVRTHAKSVTIDIRTLEFKFKTMNFHKNGTPLLKKLTDFESSSRRYAKCLLRHRHTCANSCDLCFSKRAILSIKGEVAPHLITVIFDGSTRVSEVFSMEPKYKSYLLIITLSAETNSWMVESMGVVAKFYETFDDFEIIAAVAKCVLTFT